MAPKSPSTDVTLVFGLLWLVSLASLMVFDPVRGFHSQQEFYSNLAAAPFLYQLPRLLMGGTAFIGIAAVLAITTVFRDTESIGVRWASVLATIGFALTGISQVRFAVINPERARMYVRGDEATRVAIEAGRFMLQLDPEAIMSTLFLVIWLVILNIDALRKESWPRGVCVLGLVVALISVAGMGSRSAGLDRLRLLALLLNRILLPVWFLWLGFALRRRK